MKVVIVDLYHDSDRGGVGIVNGLLNCLFRAATNANIDVDVSLVRRFSEDDPKYLSANRHLSKCHPDIPIYGMPISTKSRDFWGAMRLLLLGHNSSSPAAGAISQSDLVISKGGQFYASRVPGATDSLKDLFFKTYNLLLCLRYKKPLVFLSHSVGPFQNHWALKTFVAILRRAYLVSTREEHSRNMLVDGGMKKNEVRVLPDTAFAIQPAPVRDIAEFLRFNHLRIKQYAVVTARSLKFPNSTPQQNRQLFDSYLRTMAGLADFLLERRIVDKVVLVAHCDGQHAGSQDDAIPIKQIFSRMRLNGDAVVIEDDLSAEFQTTLYGNSRIVLGTRLHSVIFALVGGAPALAVNYHHKVSGIMEMLGLEKFVVNLGNNDMEDLKRLVLELVQNEEQVVKRASSKIAEFRESLTNTLEQCLVNLAKEKPTSVGAQSCC